jgi:hypothetical protein
MRNKLWTVLLSALFLGSCLFFMATPSQAFAATSSSSTLNRPPSYAQGYRQGYNDAVFDCQRNTHRFMARSLNDYNRGYVDGYNYARAHDRACVRKPPRPNPYIQGYRQGYNDAVFDCWRNSHRFMARSLSDYDRGYVDGYNYARAHDRACTRH